MSSLCLCLCLSLCLSLCLCLSPSLCFCFCLCLCLSLCFCLSLSCLSSYVFSFSTKDNFTFKCHRSVVTTAGQTQDIFAVSDSSSPLSLSFLLIFLLLLLYAYFYLYPLSPLSLLQVNDIAFHPTHGTLATVGSDGRYYFWDKDARTKLKVIQRKSLHIKSILLPFSN